VQVLVNCDDRVYCDEDSIRRIEGVIEGILERFSSRISRVEAFVSDRSDLEPGDRTQICSLEARISGATSVVAKHAAATLAEAIHHAAAQLERFLIQEIRQLDAALAAPGARPSTRSM
jgi:hypothetical protein